MKLHFNEWFDGKTMLLLNTHSHCCQADYARAANQTANKAMTIARDAASVMAGEGQRCIVYIAKFIMTELGS